MIKFKVMDRIWKVRVLSGDDFMSKFDSEDAGVTLPITRELFLHEDELSLELVVHELAHIYYDSCCTKSATLDSDQFEEVFCDIVAVYGEVIWRMARKLYKELK